MLLIIDNNKNICKYFSSENVFLDVSDLSLTETLKAIQAHVNATKIYFPIELKFKDTYRQNLHGLELFKHIRLTPELGKLQYAPILLGYTYPLETILRNPESTIICSPATQLFYLKNIWQVNDNSFFSSNSVLIKEALKPYILFTDSDEAVSEHDRRNEHGSIKFKQEIENKSDSAIGNELWKKKVLFLQPETKASQNNVAVSDADFKKTIKGKRILYLDDEGEKWESNLKKLFTDSVIDLKNSYEDIERYFSVIKQEQNKLLSEYEKLDGQLIQLFHSKDNTFQTKSKEIELFVQKLSGLIPYDLILLDMRLDRVSDKSKSVNQFSGVQILNKIQKINPFIPIIMFTASNKIESYKDSMNEGAYDYWIKNVSSANDLKSKCYFFLENKLVGNKLGNLKEVRAKQLMIANRVSIFNYCVDRYSSNMVSTEAMEDLHRDRIDNSIWNFTNYLQRSSNSGTNDFNVEELWKLTGDLIQIRIPVIQAKKKSILEMEFRNLSFIKNLDKEFDYRWIRNHFLHNKVDQERYRIVKGKRVGLNALDKNLALEYIAHTIDFLLDYR